MVGAALGGPYGVVAGKMIQQALGVDDPGKLESVIAAGNPDVLLKLKEADLAFRQFMKEADLREEQLVYEDRADARGMAKALGTTAPQMAIVVALTLMIGWIVYELFGQSPPKGSENVLFILLGQVSTAWMAAISFFVGTTRSSAEKNAIIMASK